MAHLLEEREVDIIWMLPGADLPLRLAEVSATAVALPLRVRGGGPRDRFTRRIMDAIEALMSRGVPVLVAEGSRVNPLSAVGIPAMAGPLPDDALPARSASEACVRAAAWAAEQRVLGHPLDSLIQEIRRG